MRLETQILFKKPPEPENIVSAIYVYFQKSFRTHKFKPHSQVNSKCTLHLPALIYKIIP